MNLRTTRPIFRNAWVLGTALAVMALVLLDGYREMQIAERALVGGAAATTGGSPGHRAAEPAPLVIGFRGELSPDLRVFNDTRKRLTAGWVEGALPSASLHALLLQE